MTALSGSSCHNLSRGSGKEDYELRAPAAVPGIPWRPLAEAPFLLRNVTADLVRSSRTRGSGCCTKIPQRVGGLNR